MHFSLPFFNCVLLVVLKLSYPWESYPLCILQTLKQLENAIVSSPLGLNPQRDGDRLIAAIPP